MSDAPRARSGWPLLLATLALLAACTTNPQAPAEHSPGTGALEPGTGTILFRSVLQRAIPGSVDRMTFVAYDAEGNVVYGPTTREKAAEIPLYDVTTQVAALLTVYQTGNVVRGLDANRILLPPGGTVVVEGTFRDLAGFVTLSVEPRDATVPTGAEVPYTCMATVLGTRSYDVTDLVEWSSSDPAVVAIVPGGLATAATAGTATVSARYGTLLASTSLTVTGAALTRLEIEPPDAILPEGVVQPYHAVGFFDDGSSRDMTHEVAWSTDDGSVATIAPDGQLTAVAAGSTTVRAADPDSGAQASTSVTVEGAPVTLVLLQITPLKATVPVGRALPLTATGVFSDGTVQDLTRASRWTSSDPRVAGVSEAGLAHGLAQGTTTVRAAFAGVEGKRDLQVTAPVLTALEVHPRQVEMPVGSILPFQATGRYSDGSTADLTEQVSWSSDAPATAWVADAPGSKGQVTAVAVGQAAIRATDPDTGTSGVGVAVVIPATLVRLEVAPDPARVLEGRTLAFTATGIYSDDSTRDLTGQVTWSTGDPSVAEVGNSPGSQGICLGVAPGQTTVAALEPSSGLAAQAALTVVARPEVRLEVAPVQASIPAGTLQPFQATLIVGDDSRFDVTHLAAWESSDPAVAEVGNDPANRGMARGLAQGSCRIQARLRDSGLVGSADLEVTAAVLTGLEVVPPLAVVQEGGTVQFAAVGRFSDDTVQDVTDRALWTSQDPSILAVSNAEGSRGLGTALAVGDTGISARVDDLFATSAASVTPAPVTSVEVLPEDPALTVGNVQQFSAVGITASEILDLTEDALWETSDPQVLTISNAAGSKGLGTAVGAGTATVTATDPATGVSGTTLVTVTAPTPVSLQVLPATLTLPAGASERLQARATYSDSTEVDVTAEVSWTSSDSTRVSVSNAPGEEGTVTGRAQGTATVTAALPGTSLVADCGVTVIAPVATGLELLASTTDLLVEDYLPVIAIGHYSDGTQADLSEEVVWDTSNPGVVGVVNGESCPGVAMALAVGAATVSAHLPGTEMTGTWDLAVSSGQGRHGALSILPRVVNGTPSGPDLPLAAFALAHPLDGCDGDDVTTRSQWFTGDAGVFTVTGKGVVTFVGPGQSEVTARWSNARIDGIARIVVLP